MKKERYMSWHTYFMSIALLSAYRSKDSKTQNGACIVGENNKIIGIGYNGLPRGCNDNNPDYWGDENDLDILRSKHTYVVHAEKNAIYNCMLHDMTGAAMYTTQFPCNTCAQAIIQVGIRTLIYLGKKAHHNDMNCAVDKMFDDSGVVSRSYNDLAVEDIGFLAKLKQLSTIYD